MPENVEVDFDGLTTAADILNELSGNFESISSRATEIMGHMTKACGDDKFGHEFTDGENGFRKKCESAGKNVDALFESFGAYTEGVGGRTGAKPALSGTEQASGETIRRSV